MGRDQIEEVALIAISRAQREAFSPKEETMENLTQLTADIVSAYVSNNAVPASQLPALIESVSGSVKGLQSQQVATPAAPAPAVNPKRSIFPDYIVCLENGKRFKSLKRHLATEHGLTPDEYRAKWGLPADYPMVAPNYSATRSALAKASGLGRVH